MSCDSVLSPVQARTEVARDNLRGSVLPRVPQLSYGAQQGPPPVCPMRGPVILSPLIQVVGSLSPNLKERQRSKPVVCQ